MTDNGMVSKKGRTERGREGER